MISTPSAVLKMAIPGSAIIIIALTWVFVLSQVHYERREAVAAATRANIQKAMAFEQYVERTLEGADIATAYVADLFASRLQQPSPIPPPIMAIDDTALSSPILHEINVFNRNGDLVATSAKHIPRAMNIFSTKVFQGHLARSSTTLEVTPPSRSPISSELLLLLSRRISLPDGSFNGVVSARIRPHELTDFLQDADLNDTDLVSVIGLDGITRARREGNTLSYGEDLRGTLVMRMQEKSPFGTYLGPSSIDGIIRYFSHRQLPQYDLFVTSGVSEEEVLGPVRTRAASYVVGGVLITLATTIAAYLLLILVWRRIAHEMEIVAANARLREAQQIAGLGEWSFNLAREEFTWSDHLCVMYERPINKGALTFERLSKLVGQQGIHAFRAALKQSQAVGKRQEYELEVRLPSGATSYRRIVSVPDYDLYGQLIGVHGTDQDITPHKLLEALQKQVSQLSNLDAMNAVAATVAHELNQPLTAAVNYLSGGIRMIAERADLDKDRPPEALGAIEAARDQIYHAGEIIRRVRNLVSNSQPQLEAISTSEVVAAAIDLFEAANPGSSIAIEEDPTLEGSTVLVDPVQFQQVLVNLVRNAYESCDPEPHIIIRLKRGKKQHIHVCVADDGPGRAGDTENLFSSFTTSKSEGLGLGLAISRTLVEAMGGQIGVEETGPNGTVICINIREGAVDI